MSASLSARACAAVNDLLGHPGTGASWEGFVVEQIASHLPAGASMSF